ncbi:MAG: hypothetical protein KAJ10_09500, partial [Thermodesulfovibrionia bacterium]|nr:hypothetical protein [Thermodesulfovibrionia bacterium]
VVDDPQIGLFASSGYAIGPVALDALVGYTMNGYSADSHFTPTNMIGTDQTTAMSDFGGVVNSVMSKADVVALLAAEGIIATEDDVTLGLDTLLIAMTGSFQVIESLSLYGRFAYMDFSEVNVVALGYGGSLSVDANAIELDAGLEYQIADNTTFNLDLGYLMPDNYTIEDDPAFSAGQSINISF